MPPATEFALPVTLILEITFLIVPFLRYPTTPPAYDPSTPFTVNELSLSSGSATSPSLVEALIFDFALKVCVLPPPLSSSSLNVPIASIIGYDSPSTSTISFEKSITEPSSIRPKIPPT